MPTGLVLSARPNAANVVDDVIEQASHAHQAGVRQVWLAQQFDHDAIALAGLVGAAVPGLGVGTSVVPINPRHPLIVASLAQTAQAASHGNFSLGLGLGAHEPERQAFGTSFPNTIRRLRDHLTVLRSIFDTGSVSFHGDELTAEPGWPVTVAGARVREAGRSRHSVTIDGEEDHPAGSRLARQMAGGTRRPPGRREGIDEGTRWPRREASAASSAPTARWICSACSPGGVIGPFG